MDHQGRDGAHWELQKGMNSFWWCISSETYIHLNLTCITSPGPLSPARKQRHKDLHRLPLQADCYSTESKIEEKTCHPGLQQVSALISVRVSKDLANANNKWKYYVVTCSLVCFFFLICKMKIKNEAYIWQDKYIYEFAISSHISTVIINTAAVNISYCLAVFCSKSK